MFVATFIFAPVDVIRLGINSVDARCAPPNPGAVGTPTDCTFEELIGDNGWVSQDCINGEACTRQDRNIIEFFANDGCAKIKGGCSSEQQQKLANVGKNVQGAFGATNCTLGWDNLAPLYSPTCWGRTISVLIGTALITVSAWLLATAGYLFNLLIDHTVVQFGNALLNTGVRQAIDVGWTALRDIANIVIIAMFVFIAINIILGVKEFGEKKLVARVLIIAVLINFSLLFTKAIIDASNFTAYQFVKASGFVTDTADTQGAFETEFVKKGIAGEFIKFMGLASVGETYKALSNAAFGSESKRYTNANGWFALLHGLVSATLLLFAAAALLYGCYLLITRAVLLIFLMMTSALAFASWLIPQQRIVKGFARWWEALLKAALFGPLLIIFLWASLNVARAISTTTKGEGTLGALISNPNETLNLEALWSYVIVLGLLFASIYAANLFSKGIAGFSAAGRFWAGSSLTVASAASRVAGMAGRTAFGGTSNAILRSMQSAGWAENIFGRAAMRPFDWTSRQSFDPLRNQTVRRGIEGLGGVVLGDKDYGKGGFRALKEHQADELNALSKRLAPGEKDRERMADKAGNAARAEKEKGLNRERAGLAEEKTIADETLRKKEAEVDAEKQRIKDEHRVEVEGHGDEKARAEREKQSTEAALKAIHEEFMRTTEPGRKADLNKEITRMESNLKEQTSRIERADVASGALTKNLSEKLKGVEERLAPHKDTAEEKAAKLKEHDDTRDRELKSAYRTGYNKRDIALQSKSIATSMARNKLTFGREEIVKQLDVSADKDALRKAAEALGREKAAVKTEASAAPKPPAAPSPSTTPPRAT